MAIERLFGFWGELRGGMKTRIPTVMIGESPVKPIVKLQMCNLPADSCFRME